MCLQAHWPQVARKQVRTKARALGRAEELGHTAWDTTYPHELGLCQQDLLQRVLARLVRHPGLKLGWKGGRKSEGLHTRVVRPLRNAQIAFLAGIRALAWIRAGATDALTCH